MNGMPQVVDLQNVGVGFGDPVLGSQAVFRAALQALSRPGEIQSVACDAGVPAGCDVAAAALLLALLDQDCTLWLSPALARGQAAAWLRFHTGCSLVRDPGQARFAWIGSGDELPELSAFASGSEFDPETSTTCVVQVRELRQAPGWTLSGPGIRDRRELAVLGLPTDFLPQWQDNHALFPRGVDLLLSAGSDLAGLPRTTRIEV